MLKQKLMTSFPMLLDDGFMRNIIIRASSKKMCGKIFLGKIKMINGYATLYYIPDKGPLICRKHMIWYGENAFINAEAYFRSFERMHYFYYLKAVWNQFRTNALGQER